MAHTPTEAVATVVGLKVGIVGAGLRGRMFADVIAGIPGADIVGFADPYQTSPDLPVASRPTPVFADTTALLDSVRPDAVILATPDHAHAPPAVEVARRGIAMMLEKPVATTIDDTRAIRDAVRAGGAPCMVAFENRWSAPFMKIHDLVQSGILGRPVFQSANLSNSYHVPTVMLHWAASSSPLWFLMPHTIDLVTWLSDSWVTTVMARGTRGLLAARGIDTWDVVHVVAELDDGSTATLTSSWVLPEGSPSIVDFTYELVGSRSSVRTDIGRSGIQHFADRHVTLGVLDSAPNGQNTSAPAWMARSFVDSIMTGSPVFTTIEDGIAVNNVLFAIERSLASGRSENVTPLK
ncbi:MAG: Gfo/Idh/MocA family oxidoreductase [Terrimesophilobacter sp.]